MTRSLITPTKGRLVPKPDGTALADDGELLEVTGWWRRREADGDVNIVAKDTPKGRKAPVKPASET